MWIVDDTGFIKKGVRSAGVARQYTGTSGKIDNCQLGVFLAYGSARGRALVDRELYLPTSWTEDRDRCAAAGVPAEVGFATKPQLGIDMLARADAAGVLAGWVTADEAFGQNRTFRSWLAAHEVPFVLATRSDDTLTCPDGRRHQAKNLLGTGRERRSGNAARPVRARTANGSTTGPSWPWPPPRRPTACRPDGATGCWSAASSTRRRAPILSWRSTAAPAPWRRRCRADPGRRRAVGDRGMLPDREERGRPGPLSGPRLPSLVRPHHMAMLAAAYLAATRAQEAEKGDYSRSRRADPVKQQRDPPSARHLVLAPVVCVTAAIDWSNWRRRRQHQARACHYRRRGHRPP